MPLFDQQILRKITSPESFRRGKKYVEDDAVDSIRLERLPSGGIFVVGTVYGSYTYHTNLTINEACTEIIAYDCDCPAQHDVACKHVVALGLVAMRRSAIGNGAKGSKGNQKTPKDSTGTTDHALLETGDLRTHLLSSRRLESIDGRRKRTAGCCARLERRTPRQHDT